MRFAAIDIGSNGVRLLFQEVYQINGKPTFKKLSLVRLPIRLGDDAFLYNRISDKKAHQLIKMAKAFKHLKDVFEVVDYRACATSAIRDSENGPELIARILKETGISINVIDGGIEAGILFESIFSTNKLKTDESYMFIDVGGGSTEVNFYVDGERMEWKSFNVGTIRIKEGILNDEVWEEMGEWISARSKEYKTKYAVGTGGNINKLYKLCGYKNWETLEIDVLAEKLEWLKGYSVEEMIEELGLKAYRADVIVPGGSIYLKAMESAGLNKMIVPKVGLADGLIRRMYLDRVPETKSAKGSLVS